MFTGIIEDVGKIKKIHKDQSNLLITITSCFVNELKINQSISHNGICLSVVDITDPEYVVCAVKETIKKTNIKSLKPGDLINLERSLIVGSRIDGHIIQGHVDCAVECVNIEKHAGSWFFTFKAPKLYKKYLAPQGSVAVNGVSLTIATIDDSKNVFSITIIPYTFEHTNFKNLKKFDLVNIEFDIIAKQISRMNSMCK